MFRESGQEEVQKELQKFTTDGETFYSESGDLYKHVGLLRAADIFWNKEK
jgi:hypothetical protein